MRHHKKQRITSLATLSAVLGAVCAGGGLPAHAQTNADNGKLQQENEELKQRVERLEETMKKEGILPSSSDKADPPVAALTDISISGFVTASYFYDLASSKDTHPTGYLWNGAMNQFTLNKAQLIIQSPAVQKDKWDAGFFLSLLYGEDEPVNDKSGGAFSAIRQAYVDLNIPIGTGLDFRAGTMTSLLNYESGDGGVVNDNFSQGYQWFYTGNPPAATAQLGYDFNDMFGIKVRLQNGLYNGEVGTGSKTFMGGFYIKPDSKTSIALLGFEGQQNNIGVPVYNLDGGSIIASRKLTESYNLTLAVEGDYFHYSGFNANIAGFPSGDPHGDFWSVGGWLTADIAPKMRLALRAELIDDPSGFGTIYNSPNPPGVEGYAGAPGFPASIYTSGQGQDLTDITLTLDYKPTANIKIQPEIRWNHSTVSAAFNGKSDQVIAGMGVSYLF
jgi:Putative beta-barrel porin-2, OmpL-like. bbp2